jgi:ribosome-associated toxin RatA of RatAB toxin-antitoxin module
MPRRAKQATLAYDELFDVVVGGLAVIGPLCSGVYVYCEDEREIIADLFIGSGPLQEPSTSQVTWIDRHTS